MMTESGGSRNNWGIIGNPLGSTGISMWCIIPHICSNMFTRVSIYASFPPRRMVVTYCIDSRSLLLATVNLSYASITNIFKKLFVSGCSLMIWIIKTLGEGICDSGRSKYETSRNYWLSRVLIQSQHPTPRLKMTHYVGFDIVYTALSKSILRSIDGWSLDGSNCDA